MNTARRLSPLRLLTAVVLSAWAGLFWFLIVSGRSNLYLSTRTDWVIPIGAVVLSAAALGRFLSVRVTHAPGLTRRDLFQSALMVLPVIAVVALPPASLGSYAAGRRSNFSSVAISASTEDLASGELSLIDLGGAIRSTDGLNALTERAGSEVSFDGFVVRDKGMPADEFQLTRFIVTCCVADALEINVRVVGVTPGRFSEDEWVNVEGLLYPLGTQIVVQATEITPIPKPKRPYLTP
jgi:putative membrane protein